MTSEIPEGLYFTKAHEWVKIEDSKARIGISDYAQDQLGDIVFAELPEVDTEVKQAVEETSEASELGAVESIKTVSAIYPPLSGKVEEVNEKLEDQPELINEDPYGNGWICVLEPSNLEEDLENLMDSDEYEEFLKSEE